MFIFKAFSSLKKKKKLFRRESTWKAQEGETTGKCDSTENVCPPPPTTSEAPTLAAQISC